MLQCSMEVLHTKQENNKEESDGLQAAPKSVGLEFFHACIQSRPGTSTTLHCKCNDHQCSAGLCRGYGRDVDCRQVCRSQPGPSYGAVQVGSEA